MDFRGNKFIIIIIYTVHFTHDLSEPIHEQCAFFTFSTVAFYINKHMV